MRALTLDLRQTIRQLVQSPVFAVTAIATLAIGLGINTAMFALMDALLLRPPFHVSAPEQVVRVQFRIEGAARPLERTHYPTYLDLKTSGAFRAVAAYTPASVSIDMGPDASVAHALLVSPGFFDLLGPRAQLGWFPSFEAAERSVDLAVISHAFWQRRFGGAASTIGAPLTVDGKRYLISGVAPRGFQSLSPRSIDVWLPLDHAAISGTAPPVWRENRGPFWLAVVARLEPGGVRAVVEERATATLRDRRTALGETDPGPEVVTTSVVPGRGNAKTREGQVSLWLSGVSAFVLLIACANILHLVLAQQFKQRRDYFIRLTLGASRGDLVRQSLPQALAVIGPAAILGLVVSFLFRNAVSIFLSEDIPLSRDFWDTRITTIMVAGAASAFLFMIVVSLSHLLWSTGGPLLSRANPVRPSGRMTRRALLAMQAGMCLSLVFLAGLFAMSLKRVEALDLGVELDQTLQVTINLPLSRRSSAERQVLYERARDVFTSHPDVLQASLAEGSPFLSGRGAAPGTDERPAAEVWRGLEQVAFLSRVGHGFFSTVGARSLRGRDFGPEDRAGAPLVAIINEPLARHLWPSTDALGRCMWLDETPACLRVVGVLGGVWKMSALKRDQMALYVPLAQGPDAVPSALFVRPRVAAAAFVDQARSIAQSLEPDLLAARVVRLREIVDPEFKPWRLGASVFTAYALVALLIASVGLYGVVAVEASARLREIGIRMALGARWSHIARAIAGESLTAVAIGLAAAILLILPSSRLLRGVLFQTSPTDGGLLVASAGILILVSLLAMAAPTVRAIRGNPTAVLRLE